MITLAEIIETKLNQSPFLADGLHQGLVHASALAREWQPEIANENYKDVTEGAIVMALKRYIREKRRIPLEPTQFKVHDITLRSNLIEYVFQNDIRLHAVHRKLVAELDKHDGLFLNFAQGVYETTLVMSEELEPLLLSLTKEHTCIATYKNLSTITLRLPGDTAETIGVYYPFFRVLAWAQIKFVEIISVYSELTFVLEEQYVDQAFLLLKKLVK